LALTPGTRLGIYHITAPIGEGGMGQVYRATDTTLGRQVAIKILPDAFASDPERLARFQREAKTLASLNHPHIAAIYGFEKSSGLHALVMELVDGEDLSQRITRGAIPMDEALPIARQIAEALEAAHEQGIIHRDLKPANIKVRPDGAVKVLDFGLAKAIEPAAGSSSSVSMSPTMLSPAQMSGAGVILGTAAYMAPEQARGKVVDKRADIWAFGVVVYEMLTGRRAFEGDEISDVLAAVLRQDVDWSALPVDTPSRLRQLLERCLDRDPKTRLRDMGEARVVFAHPGAPLAPARKVGGFSLAATAVIAAVAAVLAAVVVMTMRPSASPSRLPLVRLSLDTPDVVVSEVGDATISPDGTKVVFSGRGTDGRKILWTRPLGSPDATPLPDTDDAIEPFWSWDGKSIAFGAQGKLKRLDLGATRAKELTDAARSNNGSWSRDGVIVFSADYGAPLFQVPAAGGKREEIPGTKNARYPLFLPDGKHFLYSAGGRLQRVLVRSLDSLDEKELLTTGPAIYAPPGWLLYVRDGIIVAHAFDANRAELSGDPLPIAPAESDNRWAEGSRLSVSETGVLMLARAATYDYQLAWFDRTGVPAGALGPVRNVRVAHVPRISPDGSRVVVQLRDSKTQNQDFWLGDVIRGTFERFTTTPAQEQLPVWSPDGRYVLASTARNQVTGIYRIPVEGGTDDAVAVGTFFPADVTRDGHWLFFTQRGESTRLDVWTLPLTNGLPSPGTKAQAVLDSAFNETSPTVSPDGHWLAYTSDVSGADEVYVRPLTEGHVGPPTRVTNGGGDQPCWSREGRTLFFVSAAQGPLSARMMSVAVTQEGDALRFGTQAPLFQTRMLPLISTTRDYDVRADGRFLVGTVVGPPKGTAATVILNWQTATKR
jgi:Tol biopolymer transport system component